jgi:hypothetical protein
VARLVTGRRPRVRLDLLLALVVAGAVAAAALVHQGAGAASAPPAPSPRPVVLAFSQGYFEYLAGARPLAAVPDATAAVRSLSRGAIPAASRSGPVRVTQIDMRYVAGTTAAQAVVGGRDRKHLYTLQIGLRYAGGRWLVGYIVPPDLDTILAAPASPSAATSARTPTASAAQLAAGRFALAYVDYREGVSRTVPPALPAMLRQIAVGQDPLVATTPTHAPAKLVSLRLGPIAYHAVAAAAVLRSGGQHLQLEFDLEEIAGHWEAWGFPEAPR